MGELASIVAAASLGAMVFFATVVAPTIFRTISAEQAGALLRALFPRYFLANGMAATLAAVLAPNPTARSLLFAGGGVLFALRLVAVPVINQARDSMLAGVEGSDVRFERWHRGTVIANLVEMALLAIALLFTGSA